MKSSFLVKTEPQLSEIGLCFQNGNCFKIAKQKYSYVIFTYTRDAAICNKADKEA